MLGQADRLRNAVSEQKDGNSVERCSHVRRRRMRCRAFSPIPLPSSSEYSWIGFWSQWPLTGARGDDLRRVPEATVTIWLVGIGLLLLRAMCRRREIAVRLALGVSWGRLARQFLTEASLLAALGGSVALTGVALGTAWLQRIILPEMRWEPVAAPDPTVLAVAGLSIIGTAFAAGLAPLLYARSGIAGALREGSLRGHGRRPRMQVVLLALQGALSALLLVGAGLFIRSLQKAETVDIVFDRHVLAVQLDLSGTGRGSADQAAFF